MSNIYKTILNERIEQYGIDSILDEEALSVLTGISIEESRKAIEIYGLIELIKFSDNFKLTKSQRKKLQLLYSFSKRLNLSAFKEKILLNSSSRAGEFFKEQLQFYNKEIFLIGLIDSQNRLIKCEKLSEGTINEAIIYPREVIKTILNNNASGVILSHLHPSGSLTPSDQDIKVTNTLTSSLKTISVKIIDHIIVGDNKFFSFAENGLINS